MSRSRIMNLKTGLTTCPTCGGRYSWNIQVCPFCAKRAEEARKAAVAEAAPVVVIVSETQACAAALCDAAAEVGVEAEWLTAEKLAHLADAAKTIDECPKDLRDLRGDTAL